jgi:hypothetical protein
MRTTTKTIRMRKTKTVTINRRQIATAALLGLALCVLSVFGVAQDNANANADAKKTDDTKQADDTKKAASEKKDDHKRDYGVIFGTAYGPDDLPMYGVRVTIHPVGKKHPSWELQSDHRGEFAQRVPPAPADYLVTGQAEIAPVVNGKPQTSKKKRLRGEAKVHMDGTEWHDFSLHLNE